MKITLIAVGKIREDWINQGIAEYSKRLRRFVSLDIIEVPDEPEGKNASRSMEKEAEKILGRIPPNGWICTLTPSGEQLGSEGLAEMISRQTVNGISHFIFIIGGSRGLAPAVLQRSQKKLSFGKHTFPHQLFRVMLLEQIYRAEKIRAGETYHK